MDEEGCAEISDWSEKRYGFVPNLLRALSQGPAFYRRHTLALTLLEAPQTALLSARRHAMVRRLVNRLNQGSYFDATTLALMSQHAGSLDASEHDDGDRVVLAFAEKLVRNAYKVTAREAQQFRDNGLDDAAYIDVLNTVSIQTSLDRVANSLGVKADSGLLLPV